jgi:hypothetical protein
LDIDDLAAEMADRLAGHGYTPTEAANLAWHMILVEMAWLIGMDAETIEALADADATVH